MAEIDERDAELVEAANAILVERLGTGGTTHTTLEISESILSAIAPLIREQEREACAKAVEAAQTISVSTGEITVSLVARDAIADYIRQRGKG